MTCAKLWRTILETETLRSLEAVVATGESWGRTARLRRLEQRLTKIDLQRISDLSPTTISKIEESDTSVTQTTMRRYSLAVGWDERTLEQLRAGRRVLLGGSQDGSGLSDENIARVAEAISRVQPLRTQIVDVTDLSRSDIGLVELLVDRLRRRDP